MSGYRGRGGDAPAEPVAVLQAALRQLAQKGDGRGADAGARHADELLPFVPAPSWTGPRRGYFFSTGDEGTGYYLDPLQDLGESDEDEGRRPVDAQELLRQAEEQAEAAEVQLLDERSLRKMLNAFDKRAKENLELRMKFGDEPMRFIDNEVDLMSLIRGLAQVAADPNALYPLLIDSPAVPTLAGLLGHDNTDIALEVMDLLQELTDADEEQDNQGVAGALVDALLEANALELLVERLAKLNEAVDEEAAAVNHCLALLEHALELRPSLAEGLVARTKLLKWLLSRIRVKGSDSNKQYASEILSILLQGHEANQAALGKAGGVDTLLVCLAGFKSREPADAEEQEFVENVFDSLCSCLLLPANRAAFVECEGVELMHLLLKGKKSSRYGAIKALDFATTRSPPACDRLVEVGALAQLFALFMGRAKIKNSKGEAGDRDVLREVEERCVSLISNLFQGVTKNSRKERLAAKFVEAEFEKVDRLMEIVFRYQEAVAACEARLADEAEQLGEDVDEDELALERMDAGLFTLQCGVVIVAALWSTGDAGLRKRLLGCLHQKGQSLEMVRDYLREYYFSLGDDGAPEEKQRQLQRLAQLLTALGVDIAAEAAEREQAAAAVAAQAAEAAADEPAAAAADEQPRGDKAADADGAADMELDEGQAAAAAAAAAAAGNGISQPEPPSEQPVQPSEPPEQQRSGKGSRGSEAEQADRQAERARQRGPEREGQRDSDRDRERRRERDRERHKDKHDSRGRSRRSRSRSRSRERRDDKAGSGSRHKRRRQSRSPSR